MRCSLTIAKDRLHADRLYIYIERDCTNRQRQTETLCKTETVLVIQRQTLPVRRDGASTVSMKSSTPQHGCSDTRSGCITSAIIVPRSVHTHNKRIATVEDMVDASPMHPSSSSLVKCLGFVSPASSFWRPLSQLI